MSQRRTLTRFISLEITEEVVFGIYEQRLLR